MAVINARSVRVTARRIYGAKRCDIEKRFNQSASSDITCGWETRIDPELETYNGP